MKILNFGSCNIDFVYGVEHIVLPGETLSSSSLEIFPGGKGLNQSIAAARAGAEVYHAGCIGTDGELLRDVLQENGVNTSYLEMLHAKTGHAIVQLDANGENSIFLFCGSNRMITESFVDKVLQNFGAGDILLLQNEINALAYIIDKAYQRGMRIALNPAPFTNELRDLPLKKLTWLILNEIEARGFAGKDTPEENIAFLKRAYPELKIVLTVGKNGSIYADSNGTIYQPAYRVSVVDTTAAGDTFIGYFISMLTVKKTTQEALNTASLASAIAVSRKGASPSIPSIEEVLAQASVLKKSANVNEEKLRSLIDGYFSEHYQDATTDSLAKILGYSVDYTGLVVKKTTGYTFSRLLRQKRCEKAAELLKTTDLPVGEIIYRVGYDNESFFRRVFKEKYGRLPLEYRKWTKGEK